MVLIGAGVTFLVSRISSSPYEQANPWYGKIHKDGAQKVYAELLSVYAKDSAAEQHVKAHEFGNALYAIEGEKGITICDGSFGYGCYHSFFIAAIKDKGEKIIPLLYKTCIDTYGELGTGCQHGIGHGILEYAGPENVLTAVRLCTSIQKYSYLGCSDGVFMDYFFPLEQNPSSLTVIRRPLDPKNPLYPCDHIQPPYTLSCYYELGKYLIFEDSKSTYCLQIKDIQEQEACFMGFGASVSELQNYEIKQITENCNASKNSLMCMTGAAWSVFANPDTRKDKEKLCKLSSDSKHCLSNSDLTKYQISL